MTRLLCVHECVCMIRESEAERERQEEREQPITFSTENASQADQNVLQSKIIRRFGGFQFVDMHQILHQEGLVSDICTLAYLQNNRIKATVTQVSCLKTDIQQLLDSVCTLYTHILVNVLVVTHYILTQVKIKQSKEPHQDRCCG